MLNQPNWFNESEYADFLAESSILWEMNIPYQKQKFENRKKLANFERETAIRKGRLKSELARDLYRAKAKGIREEFSEDFKQRLMDKFFDKLMEAKTPIKAEKSRMRPEVDPADKERDRKREDRRQKGQTPLLSRVLIVKHNKRNKIEIITRDDYNSKTHTVLKGKTSKIDKGNVTKADLRHYSEMDNFVNTKTSMKLLGKKEKEEPKKTKKQSSSNKEKSQAPTQTPPPTPRVPKDGKEITDPDSTYPDWDHTTAQLSYFVPDALNTVKGKAVSPEYQQIVSTSRTLGDSLNRFTKELMTSYPIVSEMKFERVEPVVKTGKFYSKMGVKQSAPNASIIGTATNQTLGFAIKIGEQTSPTNRGEAGQILNGILNADTQGQFAQTFSLFFKDFLNDLRKTFSFGTMYPSAPIQTHREGSIVFAKQKAEREFIQNSQNLFLNSCSDLMERFLNENTDLKAAFLYESLSGNMKFDGKTGSAQVLLSSKKDGSDLAAIPLDMNFANTLAKTDRTDMNLNFTQTPNSSGGFFQNIMQKMSTLTESSMDLVMEIERIKDSISNPLAFMNAFEIQLSSVSFRSPIVYSDFYTPESDASNFITINQGTNREQQITVPVRATYTPEGDQENVVEKGIDKILNEYMLINDYLVDNVNTNQMTLEEAYDFMCEEFGLLEKRNYRKEYDNYHAKPEQRENRSKRVLARRKMEKKGRVHKGDGKDVDHKNGNPKDNSDDNLRVLSKSKNRSMNEDHGAGFEGTPELVNKLLQGTPGSGDPFVGMKSISYLESRLNKKLKAKKK
jgi:hypothetical protein